MTRATLGLMLVKRGFARRGTDTRDGIAELKAAHVMAPNGSGVRALAAANLGMALMNCYYLTGDRPELQAARFYLEMVNDAESRRPGLVSGQVVGYAAFSAASQALLAFDPVTLWTFVLGLTTHLADAPTCPP